MRALGFGAVLWDQIPTASGPTRHAIGGAVFNVMAHLARLGEEVALVSAVGADSLGACARNQVVGYGVADDWVGRAQATTCEVAVSFDAAGEPSYKIPDHTCWDEIELDAEARATVSEWCPDCIFYGTMEQRAAISRDTLRRLVVDHPAARVFVDLNLRHPHSTADAIEFCLQHCSDLKLNEEEAEYVAGLVGVRWAGAEEFCAVATARYGIERVVITAGSAGCYFFDHRGYGCAHGYTAGTEAGDPVGAGDAFLAGLSHRLLAGDSLASACDYANRLGAVVASRSGALPAYSLADIADAGET